MHKSFAVLFAVAAIATLASRASAEQVVWMPHHSQQQVKKACEGAGAKYEPPAMEGGIYGCKKQNCDGKGGSCSVWCSDNWNKCQGGTPSRVTAPDLTKVLKFSLRPVKATPGASPRAPLAKPAPASKVQ